jgi:hypothetical protein
LQICVQLGLGNRSVFGDLKVHATQAGFFGHISAKVMGTFLLFNAISAKPTRRERWDRGRPRPQGSEARTVF